MVDFRKKLVNDDKVFDTMCNLFFRWEDECRYEDFSEYSNTMANAVSKSIGDISNPVGRENPFGIDFTKNGVRYGLDLIIEGNIGKLVINTMAN